MGDRQKIQAITLLVYMAMAALSVFTNPAAVTISSVSSNISALVAPVGSFQGGTLIYVKGTNFSPNPEENRVTVGPYPCQLLADGAKVDILTCRTTAAIDSTKLTSLPVTVTVGQTYVVCSSNNCKYNYHVLYTPLIQQIIPRSTAGGENILVYGTHRIGNLGDGRSPGDTDIDYFLIGDRLCSLIDILQNPNEGNSFSYNPNSRSPVECRTDITQQAGQYNFTELVRYGFAQKSARIIQTSYFTNQNYTQRILAQVTSMSSQKGGINGHLLTIKGTGFSKKIQDYDCKISGQPCSVIGAKKTELIVSVPPKSLSNLNYDQLEKQPSDPSLQSSPFIGSNGAIYNRYNRGLIRKTAPEWFQYLQTNPPLTPVSSKIITQLSSPEVYGQYYIQHVKGYFFAPQNGQYQFSVSSDDDFLMMFSSFKNNANISNLYTLLRYEYSNDDHYIPYVKANVTQGSKSLNLTKGFYYFEIININTLGVGFFKVMVEMPSLRSNTANPAWQVDKITIRPSQFQSQVIKVTVFAKNGSFSLYYFDTVNSLKNATIKVGSSADLFSSALLNLPNIFNYSPLVSLITLNAAGQPTTNLTQIEGYEYTISIIKYRQLTPLPSYLGIGLIAGSVSPSIKVTRPSIHSPPISGTFSIIINSIPLRVNNLSSLAYNTTPTLLANAFNSFYNSKQVAVRRVMNTQPQNNIELIIQYLGVLSPLPVTLDVSLLNGGKSGTKPSGLVQKIRPFSNREYYSPLPYDFLYLPFTQPSLRLSVKSIPILCKNCSYVFSSSTTPIVSSASRSGKTITISLANPGSITFSLADITISLLGTRCLNLVGTISSFTCQLPTNQDGSLAVPAGTDVVKVHISQIGFAITTGLTPQTFAISVSNLTPSETSPGGGIQATALGQGFPINSEVGLSVTICGKAVTQFILISNREIRFLVPAQTGACTGFNSIIEYNGQSAQFTFNYNSLVAPVVTSLSKHSSSPILKSTITITGANFARETTSVYLFQNNAKKYELSIISITSTSIQCILGGGRSGLYNVIVEDRLYGRSIADSNSLFSYKIVVKSISPTSGHKGGGYNLTISGENFSASNGTNNVFIGDALNSICNILQFTTTQIICQVPRMGVDYNPDQTLNVVVTGRIIEQSVCEGSCSFTYVEAGTPTVNPLANTTFRSGNVVTITGQGLSNATIKINSVICSITNNNNTQITFIYPSIIYGDYQIFIAVPTGWTYPLLLSTNILSIDGALTASIPYQGSQIQINGNGMPQSPVLDTLFVCPSGTFILKIASYTPSTVFLLIPPYFGQNTCNVNISTPNLYKLYGFTYRSNVTCSITLSGSGLSYTYTRNNLTTQYTVSRVTFTLLDTSGNLKLSIYNMTFTNNTITIDYLPIGIFSVQILGNYGFASLSASIITVSYSFNLIASPVSTSFIGGKQLQILGSGFITNNPINNKIFICGLNAKVLSASKSSIVIQIPSLVTQQTQNLYSISKINYVQGATFGDINMNATSIADNSFNTFYSSSSPVCFVGFNFGDGNFIDLSQISFVPNPDWSIVSIKLEGALFQGSNNSITYTKIFDIDTSQVHSGWNTWKKTQGSYQYQYVRFRHTSLSACNLAQIKIYGIKYSSISVTPGVDKVCDVLIKTGAGNGLLSNIVTYSHSATTVVTSVAPQFGPSVGGTVINIIGTNFVGPIQVTIDGISCVVANFTSTSIYCTTGRRSSPPSAGNSFIVSSNGNAAKIATDPYLYIDRWSDTETWGGEAVPREGDSVYVPKGMTLLVDQSTPVLYTVIVQGKIQFEDAKDLVFETNYFVINNGQFQAGTETNRFQHSLTIILHGSYFAKQLPILGNKVLGCRNCKFNMHGKYRAKTWTEVQSTISPGDVTFRVTEAVDWVAGQKIAVAATSYDHYESQEKQIQSVSQDGLTITVTTPFKYRHFAATQTFGTQNIVMRAEVGLLTRNIVVRGDDSSQDSEYGSHLMFTGSQANGLVGKLSYTQFTACGQPRIVGRYCTHFHMAGEVPDSYVRGISVHHSHARVITIHGTHYLLFEKSVGYYVKGHNVFVEDGIETKNVIQDNLMISSITSNTLLQSDITVASYWITNPYNTFRRNHAAGGDFYGVWYEIKEHPDGPSASTDICPMGMMLGQSRDNVAHSNRRFGLRIFKLSSRKYPCIDTTNESAIDPYSDNPAILSVFDNYTLWKNQECGFLGEELGYTKITNFKTIDSRKGGLQFHKTNFTRENVTAENCLVIGFSAGNSPSNIDQDYRDARGVIASRTDGLKFSGIKFYNFGPTMTPLQSCSQCSNVNLWVTGGKTTYFEKIQYHNILGKYIFWEKWRREIFIDLDGSLTLPFKNSITPPLTLQSNAVITPYRSSLLIPNHCFRDTSNLWDDSIYCDKTITLRGLVFTNAIPTISFNSIQIKVNLLANPNQNVSLQPELSFSAQPMIIIKKRSMDISNSWAMPFATKQYYNVHWKWGIDFTHMALAPSRLWDSNDGIVLRFNYSDYRQVYQIAKWYKTKLQLPYIFASGSMIDPLSCLNGDYYHNISAKYLFVCVSGRNKTTRQWIDLNALKCLNFCPNNSNTKSRESFIRIWSNVTQWPNQTLPTLNTNVTIPYQWNLVLDVDPPKLNYVEINGILVFDQLRDNKFEASYIWVRDGIIQIGTSTNPFSRQANIILHGGKNDSYFVVDPNASGNKMMVVTGGLQFYGIQPQTTWTRLIQTALVGATQITVASAAGWKSGDKILVSPSYSGSKQYEQVMITSISGNTINFTPALIYEHYGAPGVTVSNSYGILDARSAVGLLTRNIKITAGPDPDNWGCRVLVYGYMQIDNNMPTWKNGYAKLKGVEIDKCGQYDSTYAAIRFQNLGINNNKNLVKSEIVDSVIHNCGGFCTFLKKVSNITFNNNVYFKAKKFLVYVEQIINYYNFTNNLLVGAEKRNQIDYLNQTQLVDDVAAYEQYFPILFENNPQVYVLGNLVQGSEGEGFVFPVTSCDLIDNYTFVNNTAGSCQVAFMYEKINGKACLAAKGAIGYASKIGLMANMPGVHQKIIYSNFFFADNQRGITLRYANQIDDNSMIFKDSYISGFSRPNCPQCYGSNKISYCLRGYAVRMLAVTISGQLFPLAKHPTQHDVICTQEAFDFKAFIDNVLFENFLYNNLQIPYCSYMSIFKRHNLASDATASHYLTNTRCINCQTRSWAFFDKPNLSWRGWFGGCGELDCTGPNNYFIHDQDGSFTGQKSQLLANNSMIGDNQAFCTSIPQINGHWCHAQKLAVLEYQSIAPDFDSRKVWPIYLKYDGGRWNSTTNGWKQWQWNGPEPMNKRLARFWSVVKLHQNYNMTYESQPPSDSRYQIQKRKLPSGNASDWIIVRINFPVPNSIQVLVKNSTGENILVKPYPINLGVAVDLRTKTDICGANNYYYDNRTIQFVINGVSNCQVRVRLSSSVQLSLRMSIPVADFYRTNALTSFITNICAFLGIDTGRLKIVGVRQGSTIVDFSIIDQESANVTNTNTSTDNPTPTPAKSITQVKEQLTNLTNTLQTAVQQNLIVLPAPVTQFTVTSTALNAGQCGDNITSTVQGCDNGKNPGCLECSVEPGFNCTRVEGEISVCSSQCGDSKKASDEECDNGNEAGCSKDCKIDKGFYCVSVPGQKSSCTTLCGDGIKAGIQQCDNKALTGCTKCVIQSGYYCTENVNLLSTCQVTYCGDNVRGNLQQCDNGNRTGCINCRILAGYQCTGAVGQASVCVQACGNGIKTPGQACDNGNAAGCINCVISPGYVCSQNLYSRSLCRTICGDGILAGAQICDNKNETGCINCSPVPGFKCVGNIGQKSTCSMRCGDEVKSNRELCDNGNKTGCLNCRPDLGYICSSILGVASVCNPICGDGIRLGNQVCDNGKKLGCLTCSAADDGYTCSGQFGKGSYCLPICGDGKRVGSEMCDNRNQEGCSSKCQLDVGYTCTGGIGELSVCSTTCGDNIKAGTQECDNGNKLGCRGCRVETGYKCVLSSNMRTSKCQKI